MPEAHSSPTLGLNPLSDQYKKTNGIVLVLISALWTGLDQQMGWTSQISVRSWDFLRPEARESGGRPCQGEEGVLHGQWRRGKPPMGRCKGSKK